MDESRFDDLTRRVGAPLTRRTGLLAVVGGLLGFGVLDPADASATERRQKRRKRDRRRDSREEPVQSTMPCSDSKPCPDGMWCFNFDGVGQCICSDSALPPCGDACCPQGHDCCEGTLCCGADQRCDASGKKPRCICNSDGQPACNGTCCPKGSTCYGDRCSSCVPVGETCWDDVNCCGGKMGQCCLEGRLCKGVGVGKCCLLVGAECTNNSQCCSQSCTEGTCQV